MVLCDVAEDLLGHGDGGGNRRSLRQGSRCLAPASGLAQCYLVAVVVVSVGGLEPDPEVP